MKKTFLSLLSLLLIAVAGFAQSEILWTNLYGGEMHDEANDLIVTPDGGYAMIGFSQANIFHYQLAIYKTDSDGQVEWSYLYGDMFRNQGNSICNAHNGGFAFTGYCEGETIGDRDLLFGTVDSDGLNPNIVTFGNEYTNVGYGICPTADGNYLVTGCTVTNWDSLQIDVWLLKLSPAGEIIWEQTYGDELCEFGMTVTELSDGSIAIGGNYGTAGTQNQNAWLIRTDSDGTITDSDQFGTNGYDWLHNMYPLDDGGFIMACEADIHGINFMNSFLVRSDSSGMQLWSSNRGVNAFYQYGYDVCVTPDSGYFVVGGSRLFSTFCNDIYIMKYSSRGSMEWSQVIGGENTEEWATAVCRLEDGGVVIAGYSNDGSNGGLDMMLMRLSSEGMIVKENDDSFRPAGFGLMQNYPNPFNPSTTLRFRLESPTEITLSVFDIQGRLVQTYALGTMPAGQHGIPFDGCTLSSGTYFCRMETPEMVQTKRMLLLK